MDWYLSGDEPAGVTALRHQIRDYLVSRYGRPHEQVVVPASCQVLVETALRDAGLRTLGLWARIPHYVAGAYPAAASCDTGGPCPGSADRPEVSYLPRDGGQAGCRDIGP